MKKLSLADLKRAEAIVESPNYLLPQSLKRAETIYLGNSSCSSIENGIDDLVNELKDAADELQQTYYRRPYQPLSHQDFPGPIENWPDISTESQKISLSGDNKEFKNVLKLSKLKSLYIFKLSKKNFPVLAELTKLRELVIRIAKGDDFSFLSELKSLKHLRLDQCSNSSLRGIESLSNLQTLGLSELSNIKKIDTLSKLTQLRGLSLSTGFGIKMEIDSLKPLTGLTELRDLRVGLRVRREDYELLTKLPKLELLDIGFNLEVDTLAVLCLRFPSILAELVNRKVWAFSRCRRCKEQNLVWIFGKGQRSKCVVCERDKILQLWREFFARIREQRNWPPGNALPE